MNKFKVMILVGVVAVVLLITFGLKSTPEKAALETKPEVGFLAPDFTLKQLDGDYVKLSSLRGKPVYLNFWASWCPPCKEEVPEIEKFYQKYKGQVEVVAVNITFNDKLEDIRALLQAKHATFPVLLDLNNQGSAADSYQVYGIPASFFIDENGIIRDSHVGGMNLQMLEQGIRKAM